MIRYMKKGQDILFFSGEIQIARLIGCSDAEDTLTILEDGIFEWSVSVSQSRKCAWNWKLVIQVNFI